MRGKTLSVIRRVPPSLLRNWDDSTDVPGGSLAALGMTVAFSREPAPLQQPRYERPLGNVSLGVGVRVSVLRGAGELKCSEMRRHPERSEGPPVSSG